MGYGLPSCVWGRWCLISREKLERGRGCKCVTTSPESLTRTFVASLKAAQSIMNGTRHEHGRLEASTSGLVVAAFVSQDERSAVELEAMIDADANSTPWFFAMAFLPPHTVLIVCPS